MKIKAFIFLMLSLCCFGVYAKEGKSMADSLYSEGQYDAAAKIYQKLLEVNGPEAILYYNLGNCYYKLNDVPKSLLNFERAALLNPADEDIQNNLELARAKTTDKIIPESEMFFIGWWRNLTRLFSPQIWKTIGIVSFIILLASLLVYMFSAKIMNQKAGLYVSIIALIITVLANMSLYTQRHSRSDHRFAIIFAPSVSVKSSPSSSSTELFIIHEGTKIEILDPGIRKWVEVKLQDGKQGWIPEDSYEII